MSFSLCRAYIFQQIFIQMHIMVFIQFFRKYMDFVCIVIVRMDNNEEKLTVFFRQVKQQAIFPECIKQISKKYQINVAQLIKLPPEEIQRLRTIILTKKQNEEVFRIRMDVEWNQCEKKIFNWIAICYSHLNRKNLQDLDDTDLEYLSQITTQKSLPLIKYHISTVLKQQIRPKWTEQEQKILHQILAIQKMYKTQGEWIHVSKELFLRGDHRHYKSAKSCRQRWFNHIDPALTREWTIDEDKIMFQFINKQGKKWASISNKLNHTKNEHMIKNRFYSLIKKQQKARNEDLQEEDIMNNILKRLKTQTGDSSKRKQQAKKVNIQIKQFAANNAKQVKQQYNEMKLITSYQFNPICTKDVNENHLTFITNTNEMDASKLFKQQPQQRELRSSQLLKMSQSLTYNYAYPSPIPVTPGCDLNLFSDNPMPEPNYKSSFKFNLNDFVSKSTQ